MKILIISHEASLTGAPKYLLNFCKWLTKRGSDSFEVILGFDGTLNDDFKKMSTVYLWNKTPKTGLRWLDILLYKLWSLFLSYDHHRDIIRKVSKNNFDVILSNTSFNGHILKKLVYLNIPTISIVHELDGVMKSNERRQGIKETFLFSDKIIAVSKAVRTAILKRYRYPDGNITLNYESVPRLNFEQLIPSSNALREKLGISNNSFVVGGVGNFDKRKGFDLFIETAAHLLQKSERRIDFLWVGGNKNESTVYELIKQHCPDYLDRFHLVAKTNDPYAYFSVFDLFLMCSREDPFPLINLEVGQLGIPIISFDGTGGSTELMEMAGIECAKYLDTEHLSDLALDYLNTPSKCQEHGERLRNLIISDFIFERRVDVLYQLLERLSKKEIR